MADFNLAINFVFKNEGSNFVDDPRDHGGATHYGITFRTLKQWSPSATVENLKALTADGAKVLYKNLYWSKAPYDRITSQEVAQRVFDFHVNAGITEAVKSLQRACMAVTGRYMALNEDGVLGLKTLDLMNALDEKSLVSAFRAERAAFYRALEQKNPMMIVFLRGWLTRAYL